MKGRSDRLSAEIPCGQGAEKKQSAISKDRKMNNSFHQSKDFNKYSGKTGTN